MPSKISQNCKKCRGGGETFSHHIKFIIILEQGGY